jgi:GTP 3',8-cyclase
MYEFSEFKVFNHSDRIARILVGELPPPVTLEIDPTNACNHDCIWCVDSRHRKLHMGHMDKDVLFSVIAQAAALGVKSIVIKGGGEPLVYPWIDELLYEIRDKGLPVGIITNGELIYKHEKAIKDTCEWLRLSVDAGTAETHALTHRPKNPDAYQNIWKGVRAVAQDVFCGIIYVIHPATFHEMALTAKRAKENGCKYIAFKRVIAESEVFDTELYLSIDSNYLFARRQYQDSNFSVVGFRIYNFTQGPDKEPYKVCKGHHLVGILCADGNMYACCATRGVEGFCYGSVYENTFAEIWLGKRRKEILRHIDTRACATICQGHTSFMRYDHYNEMFEYMMLDDKPHGRFL